MDPKSITQTVPQRADNTPITFGVTLGRTRQAFGAGLLFQKQC